MSLRTRLDRLEDRIVRPNERDRVTIFLPYNGRSREPAVYGPQILGTGNILWIFDPDNPPPELAGPDIEMEGGANE